MGRLPALLLAFSLLAACELPDNDDDVHFFDIETPAFAYGADVSWASEMNNDGYSFKRSDGSTADIYDVLKDAGINSIRLRVWTDEDSGCGMNGMRAEALRASRAGMAVMVDFHYSDFFADPGRQDFPAGWNDCYDLSSTTEKIRKYTETVLRHLQAAGITPAWIQIGNETRNGMLWPLGQIWSVEGSEAGGWDSYASLYGAGYEAAKHVFPSAIVMPHLDNAYEDNAWWFRELKARGRKFDAIALSHYPQTAAGMTPEACNAAAVKNIKSLAENFGVPVYVSEVGVKISTESASATLLKSFIDEVRIIPACKGVFYWEPEVYGGWKPAVYESLGWNAYDMGAFLGDGRPSNIMNAFKH